MRIILILISFIALNCSTKQNVEFETSAVIAAVYTSLPKELPPPPPNNGKIEKKNSIEYVTQTSLKFNDAINENFVYYNFDYINGIPNNFRPSKSSDILEKVILDSTYMTLIAGLNQLKTLQRLNKPQLSSLLNNNLVFWDEQTITIREKQKTGITGVLSFSNVSFNADFSKAAIAVGDYSEHIGGGVGLYLLEKLDDEWLIIYTTTLSQS